MDNKIGSTLADLRKKRGISQEKLAKDLDISVSSVRKYEYGERTPNDDTKMIIAKYYGKTVGELFFGE